MNNKLFEEKFSFLTIRTDSQYFFFRARKILPRVGLTHAFQLCGKTKEDFDKIDLGGINFVEMSRIFERQGIDLVTASFTEEQLNDLKMSTTKN